MSDQRTVFPGDACVAALAGLSRDVSSILQIVTSIRGRLDGVRKEMLTVEEVASLTDKSAYTVRRWIKEGRLPAVRVKGTGPRGRLLIKRDDLDSLLLSGVGAKIPALAIS